MSASTRLLVIGTTLFALLSGCGGKAEGDYAAVISWAINGMLPNPEICREQGIVRGRFEVQDRRGKNAQTLEADCSATVRFPEGAFGGFETSYAFKYDVPYLYTISLVDAAGRPLAEPVRDEMVLSEYQDDVAELPTIDFLQPNGSAAALHGEWRVVLPNGAPIDDIASNCTQAGIHTIYIVVTSRLDPEFTSGVAFREAKCAEGKYDTSGRELATGDYYFRYEAVSAGGSIVQIGEPIEVFVDGSGDVVLPRETFSFAAR